MSDKHDKPEGLSAVLKTHATLLAATLLFVVADVLWEWLKPKPTHGLPLLLDALLFAASTTLSCFTLVRLVCDSVGWPDGHRKGQWVALVALILTLSARVPQIQAALVLPPEPQSHEATTTSRGAPEMAKHSGAEDGQPETSQAESSQPPGDGDGTQTPPGPGAVFNATGEIRIERDTDAAPDGRRAAAVSASDYKKLEGCAVRLLSTPPHSTTVQSRRAVFHGLPRSLKGMTYVVEVALPHGYENVTPHMVITDRLQLDIRKKHPE